MKIIKYIFIILFLIILSELAFFIYLNFNNKNIHINSVDKITSIDKKRPLSYQTIFDKYLIPYFKKLAYRADNNLLTNLIVTEEYEGIIQNIEFKPGKTQDGIRYTLTLTLSSYNQNTNITKLLNDRDLSIMKFYEVNKNGEIKNISINDFKKGDYIILSFKSNYLKHPDINLIEGFIKRINN